MVEAILTYHVEGDHLDAARGTLTSVLGQAQLAECLGFRGVWFAEHHFGGHRSVMPAPLLAAAHLGAMTERLRVGTSVVCLPLHHAVEIAEHAALVDVLTGGRLDLGLGTGSAPLDFAVFGTDPAERHSRFSEGLVILRQAFSGAVIEHGGEQRKLPEVRVHPQPVQRFDEMVWIAASSEATARLAGQWGAGLQLPRGRSPEAYVPIITAYRQAWKEAGHTSASPRVSIARCLFVADTQQEALAKVERATRRFARRWEPKLDPDLPIEQLVAELHFAVGTPEKVLEQLSTLQHVTGLTHLSVQPLWEDLPRVLSDESLHLLSGQVLPQLAI
ncbi:MAG: LLM class flavin-dependent oxidoreductase [Chloroflexi bacterium]|nr:LLM class flavin-dependent oxidoreductase [Chloroflexota bacterium]